MTQPSPDGPYDNSIRSDSPSGIRGLWRQIGVLTDALANFPLLVSLVADIRNDLRALAGDYNVNPEGWQGLKAWLEQRIYSKAEYDELESTLINRVNVGVGSTIVIRQYVVGSGFPPSIGRGEDAYNALLGLQSGITGVQAQLASLSDDIGTITETPAGLPIKGVLSGILDATRRSADCCEGGGGGPTDPPVNEPPAPETRCATENGPSRATNYVLTSANVNGEDLYFIEFASAGADSGGQLVPSTGTYLSFSNVPILNATVALDVCIDWNLTNDITPDQLRFYRFLDGGTIQSGFSSLVGNLNDAQNSSVLFDVDANASCAFAISVAPGAPVPGLNFFVNWQGQPV